MQPESHVDMAAVGVVAFVITAFYSDLTNGLIP
jgi:hypothetical protein